MLQRVYSLIFATACGIALAFIAMSVFIGWPFARHYNHITLKQSANSNQRIDAGPGDDIVYGGAAQDELRGGEGNDQLFGGGGSDRLTGGPGDDRLEGDAGSDTFVFDPGDGRDVILDFTPTGPEADIIEFRRMGTLTKFEDIKSRMHQVGKDVVLDISAQDSVRLSGVILGDLSTSNFKFSEW